MLGETDTFGADYTTDDQASGLASVNLSGSAFRWICSVYQYILQWGVLKLLFSLLQVYLNIQRKAVMKIALVVLLIKFRLDSKMSVWFQRTLYSDIINTLFDSTMAFRSTFSLITRKIVGKIDDNLPFRLWHLLLCVKQTDASCYSATSYSSLKQRIEHWTYGFFAWYMQNKYSFWGVHSHTDNFACLALWTQAFTTFFLVLLGPFWSYRDPKKFGSLRILSMDPTHP